MKPCLFLQFLICSIVAIASKNHFCDAFNSRIILPNGGQRLKCPEVNPNAAMFRLDKVCFRNRPKLFQLLDDKDDKSPPLTTFLEKVSNTGVDNRSIQLNSLVVAKYDLPELGIFADQTYELKSVYFQGLNEASGQVEKTSLSKLDLTGLTPPSGYELYITLYSPMYHEKPVIVTPSEVGLISMKDEVLDSIIVAIPILSFWLGTCFIFASKYNQKYGGNFVDAFFGK